MSRYLFRQNSQLSPPAAQKWSAIIAHNWDEVWKIMIDRSTQHSKLS